MIPFLSVIGDNYTGCNHEMEYSNVRYYFSTLSASGTNKETILVKNFVSIFQKKFKALN